MTKKQEKFEARMAERRAKRGPTKPELMAAQGLKYVNFCLPILLFNLWAGGVIASGETPNDRIKALIVADMKAGR